MRTNIKQDAPLEYKDASGAPATAKNDTDPVQVVMSAFEEFKAANDERLKELENKGAADPVLEEKLSKIEETLNKYEGHSQKLTLIEKQKAALEKLEEKFGKIEAAMSRTRTEPEVERKQRVENWARGVVLAGTVGIQNMTEEQKAVFDSVADEYKSLAIIPDTAGGYLAPVEYVREIIKAVTEASPVRSLARVRQTANKSIQIPKRTGVFAAQWVADQGTKTETTGLAYGIEELPLHEIYAMIDVSNGMLEDAAFNMETEITTEATDQFAVAEGAAFVNGNGIGKPEGFLQNADVGTVSSGAATAITADSLFDLKHAIKTAYARNASFVLNRTTLGSVRKLKDANGQYLWQTGIAAGKPNTIDGDPYVEMPDMPNEAAGAKPIAYGDFQRAYTWVDRISMEMLRDPYTQAAGGNVRFILRKRVGGKVVLAEALKTITCQV